MSDLNNTSCNIALLISGHLRNSLNNDTFKNIIKAFRNSFNVCDVFLHTWDKYEAQSDNPIHTRYDLTLQNCEIDIKHVVAYIQPKKYIIEKQTNDLLNDNEEFFFLCNVPRSSMKFIYYSILKAYNLSKEYGNENNVKYDMVIRMRPDVYKFPHTANIQNMEYIIENIKKFKGKTNYVAGFLHHPNLVLGDNYFFLNYYDGEIYFNKMNKDYTRMCDENACISPEDVVTICKKELRFTLTKATSKGSLSDVALWIKHNKVVTRIVCNFLDKLKNNIENIY